MKFSELIPLTAALTNLALALFVLSRDHRSPLHRAYFLWGLPIAIWNLGTFFMFRVTSEAEAIFWAKFLHVGVIFLPISLLHLCLMVARISAPKIIFSLYVWHGILALANLTGYFIEGVHYNDYAYYSKAGPGYWWFLVSYMSISATTIVVLARRLNVLPPLHRSRLKSLMWACGILIFFGSNDLLPIFGIYTYPGTELPIYPFGSAAAIVYGLIVAYSVLQHQLLDIHISLGRAAARMVRLLFFFLIGLFLLLVVHSIFPEQVAAPAFYISLMVLLLSALISSFLFPRLFGTGSDTLERRILGDRLEYHDKIQNFIRSIPWYPDVDQVLDDFDDLLVKTIQVRGYQIILLEETTRMFSLYRSFPPQPPELFPEIHLNSPVFEFFRKSKAEYLSFNPVYVPRRAAALGQEAREQFKQFGPEFCFPFLSAEDPFGLLLIGEKNGEEPYTPHDLHLLSLLIRNLSLVVNQIRLKKQILLTEELELLGRMSRGMAHDLNNLLTPVSTSLQLLQGDPKDRAKAGDLLPMALRNVRTMQEYIRESLFFSNHHVPRFAVGALDTVLRKAVELAEGKLKRKGMTVTVDAPPGIMLELDEVLIQRLMANLLSNAIDASPSGSAIRIDLRRLAKTESSRDWLRIRIMDAGEGIPETNMKRIMAPYFTTKDRGDEDRGFGLGLSISRQIVQLHGGSLHITSRERHGTTVQVDLPSRQIKIRTAMAAVS